MLLEVTGNNTRSYTYVSITGSYYEYSCEYYLDAEYSIAGFLSLPEWLVEGGLVHRQGGELNGGGK